MNTEFNTLSLLEKVIFLINKTKSYLCFWFFGPVGVSKLLLSLSKKNVVFFGKSLFFQKLGNFFGVVSSFSLALSGSLKWFFCEIYITGKGFRFERVRVQKIKTLAGFRLYLGLRCVFRFLLPKDSILIGVNKRKIILAARNVQQLNNFAQKIQQLKPPAKFYRQGINLKFRVRRLQNFRHKKRH